MESDESIEVMKETWKDKRGLHFWCESIPVSKQSKDKLKRELSKKVIQDRVKRLQPLRNYLTTAYPDGNLELELIFGICKNRCYGRRNDIDNLIKHALDSLKGYLFKDDSQIKKVCATKYLLNPNVPECTGIIIAKFKEPSKCQP